MKTVSRLLTGSPTHRIDISFPKSKLTFRKDFMRKLFLMDHDHGKRAKKRFNKGKVKEEVSSDFSLFNASYRHTNCYITSKGR